MNDSGGKTAEQQAYITRFLLDYTAVPLAGGTFLRGVLPHEGCGPGRDRNG